MVMDFVEMQASLSGKHITAKREKNEEERVFMQGLCFQLNDHSDMHFLLDDTFP